MKCGAVIVETRPLDNLVDVIYDHMKFLPVDWGLRIFCSEDNYSLLNEHFSEGDLIILDRKISNQNDYNYLLTDANFWLQIQFDKILIFQPDSMILRTGIEEFLQWDYVGAPWAFQAHGGNGGLSLRSKHAMVEICDTYKGVYNVAAHGNEDLFFSNVMYTDNFNYNLAPRDVCMKFSCEAIFQLGTFGYHAVEKYLTTEQVEEIKTQY